MVARAASPNRGAEALASGLLGVKLSIPPRRNGSVPRVALTRQAVSASRIVAVTAPAGYGKTTFLAEWAHGEHRPVAWLSLDRTDDDPIVFLGALGAALAGTDLAADFEAGEVSGPGISPLGRAAPRLAAAFASARAPFVLMLDDFHVIRTTGCHDVFDLLLSAVPAGSQFVVASRDEQPYVPLRRARGELFEIGPVELAVDAAGARQIFDMLAIELTDGAAQDLVDRTEGWAAGIYLTAMVARQDPSAVASVSGEDRFVADYLHREAFSRVAAGDQAFLLKTCVLDRFTAQTCDEVCESGDSEARLRRLEASNLFLVPLDRRRNWYRYHALFREFLIGELRRRHPASIDRLHRLAARWYERNGAPELAVDHLFEAGDHDAALPLVTRLFRPTVSTGRASVVRRWLAELGDRRIAATPPLVILTALGAAMTGDAAGALRWASVADQFELDADSSLDALASSRALLNATLCRDGVEQMIVDASFAVSREGLSSEWRPTALWLLAEAHLFAGHVDDATACFHETVETVGRRPDQPGSLIAALTQLAWEAMDSNEWDVAAQHIDRSLDLVGRYHLRDSFVGMLGAASAARLLVHRADHEAARAVLTRAMGARATVTYALPGVAVQLRLRLATTNIALGDAAAGRVLLREIDEILQHRPFLGGLVAQVEEVRNVLASAGPAGPGLKLLTPAELRLLPYLQTHLTFPEIGERLFVSRNTVSTQAGSIYRKLGVSSRSDAVARAGAIGLLGG